MLPLYTLYTHTHVIILYTYKVNVTDYTQPLTIHHTYAQVLYVYTLQYKVNVSHLRIMSHLRTTVTRIGLRIVIIIIPDIIQYNTV